MIGAQEDQVGGADGLNLPHVDQHRDDEQGCRAEDESSAQAVEQCSLTFRQRQVLDHHRDDTGVVRRQDSFHYDKHKQNPRVFEQQG